MLHMVYKMMLATRIARIVAMSCGLLCLSASVHAQDLSLSWKPSGDAIILTPDFSRVVLRSRESVTRLVAALPADMEPILGESAVDLKVFRVLDPSRFVETVDYLKNEFGIDRLLPVYTDRNGSDRILDPEVVTLRFASGVDSLEALQFIHSFGSQIYEDHLTPGYYSVTIPSGQPLSQFLENLNLEEAVYFAWPEVLHTNVLGTPDTYLAQEWHLNNTGQQSGYLPGNDISAFDAWDLTKGSPNVVIAVIDAGMDVEHPDLAANVVERGNDDWNFKDPNEEEITLAAPHGTACAGIAAAPENGIGVVGVAPRSGIMPLQVFNERDPQSLWESL